MSMLGQARRKAWPARLFPESGYLNEFLNLFASIRSASEGTIQDAVEIGETRQVLCGA
jgi:hypothetical protein